MPIDLDDIANATDPYAVLRELRSDHAVLTLPSGFVAVTGYDAAVDAMRRSEFISSPIAALYRDRLPPGAANDEMSHRINFLDPPDHPRVRRLVSKVFTPRRVAGLRPWIQHTAAQLLDHLDDRDELDLLHDFAHQLPSLVISELLGVDVADRARLTALSDDVSPLLAPAPTDAEIDGAVRAAAAMHDHLSELVEQRRDDPGDDLLSELVAAEEDGERLNRAELLSLAATLYSAGHRTTRDSFANAMARQLGEPDHYARVVDGDWSVPDTVREMLRLDTPTLYVARIAGVDTELAGQTIAAGTPVLIYLAAANRDPDAYPLPDVFDPTRQGPPSLSFAHGAHYCLGASIATAELEVMLDAVASRWPHLRSCDDARSWHQRGPFRGLDSLRVRPHP